jgi:hypothetical protein
VGNRKHDFTDDDVTYVEECFCLRYESAGVSGGVARIMVGQPFDTIKTRLQVLGKGTIGAAGMPPEMVYNSGKPLAPADACSASSSLPSTACEFHLLCYCFAVSAALLCMLHALLHLCLQACVDQ